MSSSVTTMADTVGSVGEVFSGPKAAPSEITMFIASTRKKSNGGVVEASFSLQTVGVPKDHKTGAIEAPFLGTPDKHSHFTVLRRRALEPEDFKTELATHISGRVGNSRDILVYVHGFNNSLEEARFRLAQLAADGGFTGVPILFAWATKGDFFAYESDKESATASRDALEKLLLQLSETPGVGRIQILAHSMGTWLAMEALRECAIGGHRDLNGKLGDVMLAAPDIDLSVFRQQISRLDSSHIFIFVSHGDRALSLSSSIAGDRPRLGAMNPSDPKDSETLASLGVRVYDMSALSSSFIGHDTYAAAPEAVERIKQTLTKKRQEDETVQAVIDAGAAPILSPAPAQNAANPLQTIIGQPLAPSH